MGIDKTKQTAFRWLFGFAFVAVAVHIPMANSGETENRLVVQSSPCANAASSANVIVGTPGNDRLRGTPGNDVIIGLGGNDRISGLSGNDCIDGGEGRDKILGGSGNDTIYGGDGNDRIKGQQGDDLIYGGSGHDHIHGGRGQDALYGGAGNDRIHGGRGDDILHGGAGNDRILGGGGNDILYGGAGNDRILGGGGNDILYGNAGNDRLHGGRGDDAVYGGVGKDRLRGDRGHDTCYADGQDKTKRCKIIDGDQVPSTNHAPVLVEMGDRTITEGETVGIEVSATDADVGDRLSLTASNLPMGAAFTNTGNGKGMLTWSPVRDQTGVHTIMFRVIDDHQPRGMAEGTMNIEVVARTNRPPVLVSPSDQILREGQGLTLEISASDPDPGDQVSLSVAGVPQGARFLDHGDGSGILTWMPLLGAAGDYPIQVIALDNGLKSQSSIATFNIRVEPVTGFELAEACRGSTNAYLQNVHGDLYDGCSSCHSQGGIGPGFVLSDDAVASFDALARYVRNDVGNLDLLLSKSIGLPFHGGGKPYQDMNDSRYLRLQAFLASLSCDVGGTTGKGIALEDLVQHSNEKTLRKAAIILAGRLPTDMEIEQSRTDAGLAAAVRDLMQGEGFAGFVYRTANDWFLTAGSQFPGYDLVFGTYTEHPDYQTRQQIYAGLRREPLELIRFIVDNDRPYTEVVTADYTIVNDELTRLYAAEDANIPGVRAAGWRPARIPVATKDHPGIPYPHAGVLSTVAWLSRFPTTDTNRNRHRVKMMYRQFLGFDIEALGQRPGNDTGMGEFLVPVMENPACVACHAYMDPAAGSFMDFGPDNTYRQKGEHALSRDYTRTGGSSTYPKDPNGDYWYKPGDKWYRDMFAPGFEGIAMPGGYIGLDVSQADNGGQSALGWMTRELADDPRFAKGAVYFWYRGLFGRDPLPKPVDPSDPDYASDLEAYNFQDAVLDQLATRFRNNGYVIRDLLVDMVMSPLFRAGSIQGGLTEQNRKNLAQIGMERLLTPEELQVLTASLTGSVLFDDVTKGPGLLYGGFDGGLNAVTRNRDMTAAMAVVADAAFNELVCTDHLVVKEFSLPKVQRRLLRDAEPGDLPGVAAANQRILDTIRYLHWKILGEELTQDDPEIQATWGLFQEVVADGTPADPSQNVLCEGGYYGLVSQLNGTSVADLQKTIRGWNAVLLYLFGDFHYLNN